jgi:hypothetical protein
MNTTAPVPYRIHKSSCLGSPPKHLDEAERAKSPVVRTRASRCASQILKLFKKPKAPAPRGPATVAEYFGNGE